MKNYYLSFFLLLSSHSMEQIPSKKNYLVSIGNIITICNGIPPKTHGHLSEKCRLNMFVSKKTELTLLNSKLSTENIIIKSEEEWLDKLNYLYNIYNNGIVSYIIKEQHQRLHPQNGFFNIFTNKDEHHYSINSLGGTELENAVLCIIIPEEIIKKQDKLDFLIIEYIKNIIKSKEYINNEENTLLKIFSNFYLYISQEDGKIKKKIKPIDAIKSDFFVDEYIMQPHCCKNIINMFEKLDHEELKNKKKSCEINEQFINSYIMPYISIQSANSFDYADSLDYSLVYEFLEKFLFYYKEIRDCFSSEWACSELPSEEKLAEYFNRRLKQFREITKITSIDEMLDQATMLFAEESHRLPNHFIKNAFNEVNKLKISQEGFDSQLKSCIKKHNILTYKDLDKVLYDRNKRINIKRSRDAMKKLFVDLEAYSEELKFEKNKENYLENENENEKIDKSEESTDISYYIK